MGWWACCNLHELLASRDVALAATVVSPRDCRAVFSKADGVPDARINLHELFTSRDVI